MSRFWASIISRLRAFAADAFLLVLMEARTALLHGLLAWVGILPVIAFLFFIWTHHRPPWNVFVRQILVFHSFFCLALGVAIVVVALRFELRATFFRRERGFARWFKDAFGLSFVGLCSLVVLTVVNQIWPALMH
jgi:threonine/homoserine/homoserine lactone efflux protein